MSSRVANRVYSRSAMADQYWRVGAISGALAVLCGAFGAHALRARVSPELLKTWETAASYHLVHSVALLAAASSNATTAGALFSGGIVLFSGSLYALVLTGQRRLGAITPIGGVLLAAGWAALAFRTPSGAPEGRGLDRRAD